LTHVNTNERPDKFSNPFTLESGLEQLQKFFSQVKMSRYIDNLEVTEIDPLIAYIRSSIGAVDLSEEKLGELKKDLTAILEKEGKIFITKDSGLFEALK
jgi:hypothetical protein